MVIQLASEDTCKFISRAIWRRKTDCPHSNLGHGQAQRESCAFGTFKSFIKGLFSPSVSSLRSSPCLSLLVNLSQDPPLECACAPSPRWILKWRLLGGARLITAWNYPLTFDSKEPFCTGVASPLSGRVFSFVHAMIIPLSSETKTGYYPVFVGYKFFNWSPPISHLRECQGEDCRWPTWSPSMSYLNTRRRCLLCLKSLWASWNHL